MIFHETKCSFIDYHIKNETASLRIWSEQASALGSLLKKQQVLLRGMVAPVGSGGSGQRRQGPATTTSAFEIKSQVA